MKQNRTKKALMILLMGMLGCQENDSPNNSSVTPVRLQLPGSSLNDSCGPGTPITGGDLKAFADRIVVGQIASIEFVEEFKKLDAHRAPSDDECRPSRYIWALKVSLDVSQNLKGTGDGGHASRLCDTRGTQLGQSSNAQGRWRLASSVAES